MNVTYATAATPTVPEAHMVFGAPTSVGGPDGYGLRVYSAAGDEFFTAADNNHRVTIHAIDPADIPLTIKGATGQTGDLLQVDTDKLVVDANGRTGIGTTTPKAPLHVKGPVSPAGQAHGDAAFYSGVAVFQGTGVYDWLGLRSDGTSWSFDSESGGAVHTLLTMNRNGRSFEVKALEGTGTRMVVANAAGDLSTQALPTASDLRLKQDIEPLSDPLKSVQKLKGCTFKWKDDQRPDGGLIAQDVVAALGEHYATVPEDGTATVSYNAVVGLLVEALKEANQRITKLEEQINA